MILNNEATSICAACGGVCCQNHAGIAIPKDFKQPITVDFLVELLSTKKWSIDWWEGDPRFEVSEEDERLSCAYYLRPAHTNDTGIFTASWGGTCVLWSAEKGCSLSFEERPFQCRGLLPKETENGTCLPTSGSSNHDIALMWLPYQEMIKQAGELVEQLFLTENK